MIQHFFVSENSSNYSFWLCDTCLTEISQQKGWEILTFRWPLNECIIFPWSGLNGTWQIHQNKSPHEIIAHVTRSQHSRLIVFAAVWQFIIRFRIFCWHWNEKSIDWKRNSSFNWMTTFIYSSDAISKHCSVHNISDGLFAVWM